MGESCVGLCLLHSMSEQFASSNNDAFVDANDSPSVSLTDNVDPSVEANNDVSVLVSGSNPGSNIISFSSSLSFPQACKFLSLFTSFFANLLHLFLATALAPM